MQEFRANVRNLRAMYVSSGPPELLAGFHAYGPDPDVPELDHAGEQWASRRLLIPTHVHPVWEFYAQVSGESCWDGPDSSYLLRPGDFFAVPPDVPHRMHDRPQDRHHFFFAAIDLDVVLARLPDVAPLWREEVICVVGAASLLPPFRHLIREISLSLPHRAAGLRLALDGLVLESSRLLGATPGEAALSLTLRHPAVRRAKDVLDGEPGRAWRLADLAQTAGVLPNHLVECFTREVGVSPRRYLLGVRVRMAQEMLTGSDVGVTDLALELGFASGQHFAATFKRLTGETALGYRARQRSRG